MADDARISTALPSHPKTRKLRKRLGAEGCWILVCLFLWVADNRPDGDLSGLSDEDIELAADWGGETGAFVRVLSEVGFLDGSAGARLVHDWQEHNPWAASRGQRVEAARKAARERWGKAKAMQPGCSAHAESMRPACATDAEGMRPAQGRIAHHQHHTTPTPNGFCASTSGAPAVPEGATIITLPLNDGTEFPVTEGQVNEWRQLYAATDVVRDLRNMRGWLLGNPRNRKTKSGVLRFVTAWLAREQNKAPAQQKERGSGARRNNGFHYDGDLSTYTNDLPADAIVWDGGES